MDPITVRLKVYDKSLKGVLEILENASWKIADNVPRNYILKAIRKDLKNLSRRLEIYEENLTS